MADTKVSDLNSITVAGNNDILYIVNPTAGTSNKITYQNLLSGVNDSITTLTTDVNSFTTKVLELSLEYLNTIFESANIDVGPLTTDILTISGDVITLSAEFNSRPAGVTDSFVIASSTFTFLGGQLTSVTL